MDERSAKRMEAKVAAGDTSRLVASVFGAHRGDEAQVEELRTRCRMPDLSQQQQETSIYESEDKSASPRSYCPEPEPEQLTDLFPKAPVDLPEGATAVFDAATGEWEPQPVDPWDIDGDGDVTDKEHAEKTATFEFDVVEE